MEKKLTALPKLSIALTSATALSYELLLMKLFGIIQWHHFAYMVISLALLGYGASGTFIFLFRQRLLSNFNISYILCIMLFAFFSISSFIAVQHIPFNAMEIYWEPLNIVSLFLYFILLALPFFFAASAVGLALSRYKNDVSALYASDMIGAGTGSISILILLFIFFPENILKILSLLGFLAAFIAFFELRVKKTTIILPLLLMLFPFILPQKLTDPNISQYKSLSQVLQIEGTKTIEQRSGPLGMLTVVESKKIPFRYSPGLSIRSDSIPLDQLAVFTDGEGMSVITKYPDSKDELKYLDYQTSSLAYHLEPLKNILLIGVGGGTDLLQAIYHNINKIDALEINPQFVNLVKEKFAKYAGDIYSLDNVDIYTSEARGFLSQNNKKYDLINLSMVDSFSASSGGLNAINENYLYTIEAFEQYLNSLSKNGYLSISRWINIPPKDILKLFSAATKALENNGAKEPSKSIVVIRNWQTGTAIIKNGIFSRKEINSLKEFCKSRSFDIVYYAGIGKEEVNKTNRLKEAYFYDSIISMISPDAKKFYDDYKFKIKPPTDDKPYFYHFFKYETFNEIISLKERGGLHLIEWGYIVLIATLIVAVALSLLFILLPLALNKKPHIKSSSAFTRPKTVLYFFLLGIAFLFLEITFMQRSILFLSHPIYSAAIVLCSFLIFAGVGSSYSKVIIKNIGFKNAVKLAVFSILLLGFLYLFVFDTVLPKLISMPYPIKVLAVVGSIAPLAFFMGIPFPAALAKLGIDSPELIPLAWGVNGCASVISAILATLLSVHFGFKAVSIFALISYFAAYITFPNKNSA